MYFDSVIRLLTLTSDTTIQTIHSNSDHIIYGIGIDAGSQLRTKNTPHDFVYIKNNDVPKKVELSVVLVASWRTTYIS